jgi:hypothetical protein
VRNVFDYVTYQGYTDDTLYWFDENGQVITSRDMSTLDYDSALQAAKDDYDMEAETITLAFGYDSPVYQLEEGKRLLLLDYDSLERVYERSGS